MKEQRWKLVLEASQDMFVMYCVLLIGAEESSILLHFAR